MKILSELSGYGHYGIRTLFPNRLLRQSVRLFLYSRLEQRGWEHHDFDLWKPFGYERSLRFDRDKCNDEILAVTWDPSKLRDAMKSLNVLMFCASTTEDPNQNKFRQRVPTDLSLEAYPGTSTNGWYVKANFSDPVWNVIETNTFAETILPLVNKDIRTWHEEQEGQAVAGQYGTCFNGKDGKTLQIYQPRGNGLWIVGSRKSSGEYQMHDHNTDSYSHAFAHVLSLCIVLKYCRNYAADDMH